MNFSFSVKSDSIYEFINHWSGVYSYDYEWKYEKNINNPLTEQSKIELFEWKNGSRLSQKKLKSIQVNYPLEFKGDCKHRYLNPKLGGGAIWNIFYIHCLCPDKWPIFDQHVYRAMIYLQTGSIQEISNAGFKKYKIYQQEYIPFFNSLPKYEKRGTDKALVTFGRFLKMASRFL